MSIKLAKAIENGKPRKKEYINGENRGTSELIGNEVAIKNYVALNLRTASWPGSCSKGFLNSN